MFNYDLSCPSPDFSRKPRYARNRPNIHGQRLMYFEYRDAVK